VSRNPERLDLIRALEKARGGTKVIVYLTSTRPGLESQMAMDAIPTVYEHLRTIDTPKDETTIDLFLHSNGGDGTVPWRLVTLLREYCDTLNVLVPHNAFSAATLTALGADKVVMHPMGMLGPTDPTAQHPFNPANPHAPGQVLGISVEDVSSYIALVKDDVGIRHEDELVQAFGFLARKVHPLALGNVKRATLQSRMMGEKLLKLRPDEIGAHDLVEIIDKLTSQLYFHGHPINRTEACDDLRLHFVEPAEKSVEDAMWALYTSYVNEMRMGTQFDPVTEMVDQGTLPAVPSAVAAQPQQPNMPAVAIQMNPGAPNIVTTKLGPYAYAYVESVDRTDVFTVEFEATATRDMVGNLNTNLLRTHVGWRHEDDPTPAAETAAAEDEAEREG
jgi:hypothetical protein